MVSHGALRGVLYLVSHNASHAPSPSPLTLGLPPELLLLLVSRRGRPAAPPGVPGLRVPSRRVFPRSGGPGPFARRTADAERRRGPAPAEAPQRLRPRRRRRRGRAVVAEFPGSGSGGRGGKGPGGAEAGTGQSRGRHVRGSAHLSDRHLPRRTRQVEWTHRTGAAPQRLLDYFIII